MARDDGDGVRSVRNAFASIVSLLLISSFAPASDLSLKLLPAGRPFQLTFADPREIGMRANFGSGSRIEAAVGNYFSLLGLESDAQKFHFGLEGAGFFSLKQAYERFPLEAADGLIGTYFEGSIGPFQLQVRYTHVSAHLADGSSDSPIAYSRETLFLRGAYAPTRELDLYVGGGYIVNSVPLVPQLSAQWGANIFLPWRTSFVTPFIGLDFKWKEESSFNPSFSAQIGLALNNPPEAYRSFRIFYAYYNGADPRGQYYDKFLTSHSLGIEMQI